MKKSVKVICTCLALSFGISLAACDAGKTSDYVKPDTNTGGEYMLPEKIVSDADFKNPPTALRPMVMLHNSSVRNVDDVYARGYGGIVTNVAWSKDYLQNSRAFENLVSVVEHAIEDNGMYVWLYDEYGYPSGSAYGLTLKGNPEYEALGLVPSFKAVPKDSTSRIDLLYGHTEIVVARVYSGNGESDMDLSSGEDVSSLISEDGSSVTYTNRSGENKVLAAYMSKRWYENTHSMENWYAQQRYINMLESAPTKKFINVTYDAYYEYLSQYFGKGIRAFFTDEPAHQGSYFTISERQRQVIDEPDLNVPIAECLNYANSLFEVFENVYGYSLKDNLAYLYKDDGSRAAKQVRMDFYALTSELFKDNYLGQIAEWCDGRNVKSSGHLLLEETLYQNPWFAGNMLQLLGTMGIPGSDLLFSRPQKAMEAACIVSKMASSAAEYSGKKDTFAEISGAFDGTAGDMYDQLNSVGVQVCMGINNFASYYYQGGAHTEDEDKIFSAAIGRMRYMVKDTVRRTKVAMYYPYEGVSAETLPSVNMYRPTASAKEISDAFSDMCKTFTEKQVDYDLVDHVNIAKCEVKDGALIAPNGNAYSAIVLPYTTALRSETVLKLKEAQDAGVEILVNDFVKIICEKGANDTAATFDSVAKKAVNVKTSVAAANYLRDNGHVTVKLSDAFASDIYASRRDCDKYSIFTVVNADEKDKTAGFTLSASGKTVKYYNAVTGKISNVNASFGNGTVSFNFALPANTTGFFVVEK